MLCPAAELTLGCHIFDANLVFVGHVTEHGEDDKPWEETGDTVHRGGQESIPADKNTQQGFYCELHKNNSADKKVNHFLIQRVSRFQRLGQTSLHSICFQMVTIDG